MAMRRRNRCTSAGRVTAKLLLSFLAAAATPVHAAVGNRADGQAVLPLTTSPILPLPNPEPPAPAEHVFVGSPLFNSTTALQMETGWRLILVLLDPPTHL